MIEGIPEGYELVRIGVPEAGSIVIDSHGKPMEIAGVFSAYNWPIIRRVKPTTRPMTRDEFLAAWKERGWCPLVWEGKTTLSCVSEVRDDAIIFTSMLSMFFHDPKPYRFASDNSPLTVEE